jgi:p-cumate 2,3-dioxygenase beta subunit
MGAELSSLSDLDSLIDAKFHPSIPDTPENLLLRLSIENFLFLEAARLDAWELDEWLAMFTKDCRYVVPTTDVPDGDPHHDVVFIDDNFARLEGRVKRLKGRHAHREYPWSRTRRLISNVRITRLDGNSVDLESSFAVYRFRGGDAGPYIGRYRYRLVRDSKANFLIQYRRAELDAERLVEHGAVSIIL